jgi:hypothetical protein
MGISRSWWIPPALVAFACTPCSAAESVPQVPGDDIFGFSSPTDPGKPGDREIFNENDGRAGKDRGRYLGLNSKLAFGYTFASDWWIGIGTFAAGNWTRSVPDLPNIGSVGFDGLSIEILHRIVERSAINPFALTLSVEPRWGRKDPVTGLGSESFSVTFKLFTDAVVIHDTLYWSANVQFGPQRAQDPLKIAPWQGSFGLLLSTALAWQLSPSFFAGAEARYLSQSDSVVPKNQVGQAVYLGPTLLWKPNEQLAINLTVQPQLWGHARDEPGRRLDLTHFERAQFRLKLNAQF